MESSVSLNIAAGPGSVRTVHDIGQSVTGGVKPPAAEPSAEVRDTDRVDISPAAREAAGTGEERNGGQQTSSAVGPGSTAEELGLEEYLKLSFLKNRDREVRAHEQAHLAAAGQYATGGASFTYQLGPDGKRYAVGGEVPVDISNGVTPEETLQKMERIRAAALAPAEPSAADRQIAAEAAMKAAQAQREIMMERQQEIGTASFSANEEESAEGAPSADEPVGSKGSAPGRVHVSVMIQAYSGMLAHS